MPTRSLQAVLWKTRSFGCSTSFWCRPDWGWRSCSTDASSVRPAGTPEYLATAVLPTQCTRADKQQVRQTVQIGGTLRINAFRTGQLYHAPFGAAAHTAAEVSLCGWATATRQNELFQRR